MPAAEARSPRPQAATISSTRAATHSLPGIVGGRPPGDDAMIRPPAPASAGPRRRPPTGVAGRGQPPRQLVEDPPDAPLVQPDPRRDLGDGQALPPQPQQLAMGRRAVLEHALP